MLQLSISMLPPAANFNKRFKGSSLRAALGESSLVKSRETLVYMTPEEFLKLASQNFTPDTDMLDALQKVTVANKPFEDIPYLKTKYTKGFDFKVIGHEGRHRSIVLNTVNKDNKMPVRIIDSTIRWIEDDFSGQIITLYAQDTNSRKLSIKLP